MIITQVEFSFAFPVKPNEEYTPWEHKHFRVLIGPEEDIEEVHNNLLAIAEKLHEQRSGTADKLSPSSKSDKAQVEIEPEEDSSGTEAKTNQDNKKKSDEKSDKKPKKEPPF